MHEGFIAPKNDDMNYSILLDMDDNLYDCEQSLMRVLFFMHIVTLV